MTDYVLTAPPGDGITCLDFNADDLLLVSSWDSTVRLYEGKTNISKATHYFDGAVLSCCFGSNPSQAFAAGLDKSLHYIDVSANSKVVLQKQAAPISKLCYNHENSILFTGSWDGDVCLFDSRQHAITNTIKAPDKVYSIGSTHNRVVVATAKRHIAIYDVRNMAQPEQIRESPLKHQTRSVKCSVDGTNFVVGSIEGRVAIEYFDSAAEIQALKYAFKCHRKDDLAYPVNCIEFNPLFGTFATGGCDGIVSIWDGNKKKRLCSLGPYPTSISALAFNKVGSILAIAASYTFEKGERQQVDDNIHIHFVNEAEVRPRPGKK